MTNGRYGAAAGDGNADEFPAESLELPQPCLMVGNGFVHGIGQSLLGRGPSTSAVARRTDLRPLARGQSLSRGE